MFSGTKFTEMPIVSCIIKCYNRERESFRYVVAASHVVDANHVVAASHVQF